MVLELTVQPENSSRSLHVVFILARLITISSRRRGTGGVDGAPVVAGVKRAQVGFHGAVGLSERACSPKQYAQGQAVRAQEGGRSGGGYRSGKVQLLIGQRPI